MRFGIRRFRGLKTHQIIVVVFSGFLSGLYIFTPLVEQYGAAYKKRKDELESKQQDQQDANKTT